MEYINVQYLIPLLLSWIVAGWIHMVKCNSELAYDNVPLHDTFLYGCFLSIPFIAILASLLINIFMVGFVSTLCYVGLIAVTQIVNINIIYKIYRAMFGWDGLGTLIPLIAIIPLLVYLFVVQFS